METRSLGDVVELRADSVIPDCFGYGLFWGILSWRISAFPVLLVLLLISSYLRPCGACINIQLAAVLEGAIELKIYQLALDVQLETVSSYAIHKLLDKKKASVKFNLPGSELANQVKESSSRPAGTPRGCIDTNPKPSKQKREPSGRWEVPKDSKHLANRRLQHFRDGSALGLRYQERAAFDRPLTVNRLSAITPYRAQTISRAKAASLWISYS
jgi:hypothetical protein